MNRSGNVSTRIQGHRFATWFRRALLALGSAIAVQALADPVSSTLPRTVQIGASADQLRPLFAQDCSETREIVYEGKEAAPFTHQMQVDCFGLLAFGRSRKAEFLFNDGPLGHAWILVGSDELPKLRGLLEQTFGPVIHETAHYLVFASRTVALRKDPPEVLVSTPGLISDITGWKAEE